MAHQMMLVPVENHRSADHRSAEENTGQENTSHDILDAEVILSAIPKNYKNRVGTLLNHISADPEQRLQWTKRGELIYHGSVIPGSHITDLLKSSQREYKHSPLVGQQQFETALKQMNVPTGLLESRPGPPGIRLSPEKPIKWLNV